MAEVEAVVATVGAGSTIRRRVQVAWPKRLLATHWYTPACSTPTCGNSSDHCSVRVPAASEGARLVSSEVAAAGASNQPLQGLVLYG